MKNVQILPDVLTTQYPSALTACFTCLLYKREILFLALTFTQVVSDKNGFVNAATESLCQCIVE